MWHRAGDFHPIPLEIPPGFRFHVTKRAASTKEAEITQRRDPLGLLEVIPEDAVPAVFLIIVLSIGFKGDKNGPHTMICYYASNLRVLIGRA